MTEDERPSRRARLGATLRRPWRWWTSLEPGERVLYRAGALLGGGFAWLVHPALGLIVPGALFALVFFGFSFVRPRNG